MYDQTFLDVCKEYFEISIGYRRPSKSERHEASKLWLQVVFSDQEFEHVDSVRALKYPVKFNSKGRSLYNAILSNSENPKMGILLVELEVFKLLSEETDFIDDHSIPILRYEIRSQKAIFQNSNFYYAVLRQHALLETLFRVKAGLGHRKWKWALKSVYQGEHLISERMYNDLNDFNDIRNNLAHDWFSYLGIPEDNVRRVARKGLRVISRLLSNELYDTFDSYSSKHASQRFSAKLEHRDTASFSSSAKATIMISCDNCQNKFNPQDHWKRCPECHLWHGYWES